VIIVKKHCWSIFVNRRREEIGKVRRWVVVMSRVLKESRMTIVKVRQVYFDGLSK
jgi:hypothetical protein